MLPLAACLRFVGVDLHKHFAVAGAVDAQQQVLLRPTPHINLSRWASWTAQHLRPSDAVVFEATSNAWWCYDIVAPLVGCCLVANPLHIAWIANSPVKTDPIDTLKLARLLAAQLVPTVWVPPVPVRQLRALLAHRRALVKQRSAAKNRLHSILHRLAIAPPSGGLFTQRQRPWWDQLDLSPSEQLRAHHDLATLDHLATQLAAVHTELGRLSMVPPWRDLMPFLIQLPGFSLLSAMSLLAAVGDISRFPHPKQLVSYAGLAPGVHASGLAHRDGHLTKHGRRDLRHVLVETSWNAVNTHPYWQATFERLCRRKPKGVAIVACARKRLVATWYTLSRREADRQSSPSRIARKLRNWYTQLDADHRAGLSAPQFIRFGLLHLDLAPDLRRFSYGGRDFTIAPPQDLLTHFPELCPA